MDKLLAGVIEETKKYGAMNALHRAVDTKPFTAAKHCEEARAHEGMRLPHFADSVAAARKTLDDAEANYNELERMLAAEDAPTLPLK